MQVTQDEPWAKIPHWVVMHPDLDASAIRVYAVLSKHANRARHAFPGIRRISEQAHCSTSTTRRALNALEEVGAIVVNRHNAGKRHLVNSYHLPMNRVATMTTPPEVDVATIGTGVATIATSDVATMSTEQDSKNQLTRGFENEGNPATDRLPGETMAEYRKRLVSLIGKRP